MYIYSFVIVNGSYSSILLFEEKKMFVFLIFFSLRFNLNLIYIPIQIQEISIPNRIYVKMGHWVVKLMYIILMHSHRIYIFFLCYASMRYIFVFMPKVIGSQQTNISKKLQTTNGNGRVAKQIYPIEKSKNWI